MSEIEKFIEESKNYSDQPHVIDVLLPFLCSYLPNWWHQVRWLIVGDDTHGC